ncbi:hypothetical protein C5167_021099 [Papaver somniferum]|uniref:Knottin scorpion toxin-like domain-containing protein n=1 Tax=Papaver somniferum TaxID=3469 RepID=A0A4Y7IYW4_PAPSO|nr:hypothetical protein C5167_021099 [Papaver somniferum]
MARINICLGSFLFVLIVMATSYPKMVSAEDCVDIRWNLGEDCSRFCKDICNFATPGDIGSCASDNYCWCCKNPQATQ